MAPEIPMAKYTLGRTVFPVYRVKSKRRTLSEKRTGDYFGEAEGDQDKCHADSGVHSVLLCHFSAQLLGQSGNDLVQISYHTVICHVEDGSGLILVDLRM